jgi:hypothetical protein
LKAARKLQPYLWVGTVLLEEMYVSLYVQMTVDVDRSDIYLVKGQQIFHDRRDHNGQENNREDHDHTCGRGVDSV